MGPLEPALSLVFIERMLLLFVKKEKRERLLSLASKPARWDDFRDAFLHDTRNLDHKAMTPLVAASGEEARVVALLGARADARAYSVSTIAEIDGQETTLVTALRSALGREQDTIVFSPSTDRAFYENHEGERFLLGATRPR